jgi:hypothetical protein
VFVHTDHSAIRFLMNKPVTTGRITRWLLLLQEFNITIVDQPGKENVVADFLSRIPQDSTGTPVDDDFPDEHLFAVATKTPWVCRYSKLSSHRKITISLIASTKEKNYPTECLLFLGGK